MMESEINSQGEVLENLVQKYISNYSVLINIPPVINKIIIVGSGSSYNAGLFGKSFFQNISDIETYVEYASEIANSRFDNFNPDSFYIFISQSGKSEDVIRAFDRVKKMGAKTLAITNNNESYLYENSDFKIDLMAQREFAIAATKTFSASVLVLWMLAIKAAQNKYIDVSGEINNIYSIKSNIEAMIKDIENIDAASKFLAKQSGFSIIGLKENYALAKEASLKIKETCYISTSAYPMGEFLHGHFALLNKANVLVTFITENTTEEEFKLYKKIISTYKKTKVVLISDSYDEHNCHILIKFKKGESKIVNTLLMIILIQLLALKMALRLKHNVDKPTGLNKVVS